MTPQDKLIFVDSDECYKLISYRLETMQDFVNGAIDMVEAKMAILPPRDCDYENGVNEYMEQIIDIAHSINRIIEELKAKEEQCT